MEMDGNELARMAGAQLWQVTALIVVVALANRWFAGDRPHLACALWLVVLIKCLTPPLWSSPSSVFSWARATTVSERRPTAGAHMVLGSGRIESSQVATPVPRPPLDAEVNVPLPAPIDPATHGMIGVGSRFPPIGVILFVGWSLGVLATLGLAARRWRACLRNIRGSSREGGESLNELVRNLSRRLGLRRRIRLLITKNGLGPAVIGLFHPTVLVPEELLRGKSPIDLEPIVAHELIHVRRGDLWLGLLQTLAQATWWFHPLVWWTGRQVCRESERCCDEEVLAELGCDGARYARSLLDVLELKHRLVPIYTFPGVRPVEVTSNRMERIMRLRQGCHRRSPWWCWLALLSLAAATLPGAGVVLAVGEEEGSSDVGYAAGTPYTHDLVRDAYGDDADAPELPLAKESGPVIERTYEVDDVLAAMRDQLRLDDAEARQKLDGLLTGAANQDRFIRKVALDHEWSGSRLSVRCSTEAHAQLAEELATMRHCGFDEVSIETTIISGPPEVIESIDARWSLFLLDSANHRDGDQLLVGRPLDDEPVEPRSRLRTVVEKNLQAVYEVMDGERASKLRDELQNDPRITVLSAPKVSLYNGQQATIFDETTTPFVVGFKQFKPALEPSIRVVHEGLRARLRPLLRPNEAIELDCELALSNIRGVETATVPNVDGGDPLTVQVPEVATTRLDATVELSQDKTLLLGGLKTVDAHGQPATVLVMLHAEKYSPAIK